MKNVICPISNNKISEHTPRIIASVNIIMIALYIYTGSVVFLVFLLLDFTARGFGYGQYSLLLKFSNALSSHFNIKSKATDKAPKVFAARLGSIMYILAMISALSGYSLMAIAVVGLVAVLSTLEAVFGVCVGCYLYTYIVLPFFGTKSNAL